MRTTTLHAAIFSVALASAVSLVPSSAFADGRNPGSLLVFPEFDHTTGHNSVITVTNTNRGAPVRVRFKYISGFVDTSVQPPLDYRCESFTRTATLSEGDTLSVLTCRHNTDPTIPQGFLYVYAITPVGTTPERPITFNFLIGDQLQLDGAKAFQYSVVPVPFRSDGVTGAQIIGDGDNILDLNGNEYEETPEIVLVPRFIGQDASYTSELITLSLSGGKQFTTLAYFLIFNDNEEVFSQHYEYKCWARVPLTTVSPVFSNDFLFDFTNHAPGEINNWVDVAAPLRRRKSGWFSVDGVVASSSTTTIPDPALLCVLVERSIDAAGGSANLMGAELPFLHGTQPNGDLFPTSANGESP